MRAPVPLPASHLIAAGFCAGLALAVGVRAPGSAWMAAGSLMAVAAATAVGSARARLGLLVSGLMLAAWWLATVRLDAIDRSAISPHVGEAAPVVLEVTGPARVGEFTARIPVRVKRLWRGGVDEPSQLELPAETRAPPQGALIQAVARIRAPREPDGESGYDEQTYLRRHGAHSVLSADGFRIVGRRGGLAGVADRLRAVLARWIAPGLEGERRALVAGIVLGEDEGLAPDLRERFRASGLYHLLAVSGQNVAYVVAGVTVLAWIAGLARWLAHAVALVAILGYVAAVGWQPSVVRAGIAGGLVSLAWLASRPRDRWYFALVGAAVLLAWNPYALLDPGFQLSFAAVASIFVLVPRVERRLAGYPLPRRLMGVLVLASVCSLATAPILWLHFGAVSIVSVPANALAAPVVAPILGLGLGAAAVATVLPGAAHALAWLNGWLVSYLAWCARAIGGLPFAQVHSGKVLLGAGAAVAVGLVLRVGSPLARRLTLVCGAAAAVSVLAWLLWTGRPAAVVPPPTGLRVTFLDVGQGDATLLQVPEGAILVDQGPPEARVDRQLDRLGVDRLAALALTHPQRDHIGGAATILRDLEVSLVLDPRQRVESSEGERAMEAAAEEGVKVVAARSGQVLQLGHLVLRVLWPQEAAPPDADPNDYAIVMLASFGEVDVLLTADAESNVTGRLALPPVEVLKVAHHGSRDDGLVRLLERLRPRLAVVSVGRGNDYGHPTPSTLSALERVPGLRLFRTDRDGAVVVETNGQELVVRSAA